MSKTTVSDETLERLSFAGVINTRIDPEESDLINENIHWFLPDDVLEEKDIKKKHIVNNLIRVACSRIKAKKDFDNLSNAKSELEKELAEYKGLQSENSRNADELQNRIEELERELEFSQQNIEKLEETVNGQRDTIEQLNDQLNETGEKAENLQKSLTKENRVILDLSPAQQAVTDEYRQRLEKHQQKQISIGQMLFVHFWKYIKEQKTQVTFPFLLTQREIKNILLDFKNKQ